MENALLGKWAQHSRWAEMISFPDINAEFESSNCARGPIWLFSLRLGTLPEPLLGRAKSVMGDFGTVA